MSTPTTPTPQRRATTPEELLDREETLAMERMSNSVVRLGDELIATTDLRERIRENPWASVGIGASVGFLGGPFVVRLLTKLTAASSVARSIASPHSNSVPSLALAYARALRMQR